MCPCSPLLTSLTLPLRKRAFLTNSSHAYTSIVMGKVAFDQLGVKVWQNWTASDTGKGLLALHSRSFSRQSRIIFMPNTVFFSISARIPGHDFGESHLPPYFNRILRIIVEFALISCLCLAKLPSDNTWTSKAVSYHEEQNTWRVKTTFGQFWFSSPPDSDQKAALQILRIRVNSLYSQLSALFSASKRTTKRVFLVQKINRALQALTKLTFISQLRHKNGSISETSPKRNARRDKLH